ncbi:MAG TPA: glycosyltransferase family 2 protein [Bacilli bacterium]|nr:glycosyltransferase family 2 protein [Bacilli bacterium]
MWIFKLDWNNLSNIEIINLVNFFVTAFLGFFVLYKVLFVIIGFFPPKKFPRSKDVSNKYAFLIAARNEELVIAGLIESIKKQDYPSENITIFVIADNCSDKTREVALAHGAIVYERNQTSHIGKGYALERLTKNIDKDYGLTSFAGYFVFDADNLLKSDYVSKMNDAFVAGHKVVTSYRNIKNFDTNFISASYGFHQYRNLRTLHNPRTRLNLSCAVTGTGFLFASEIIKDTGWKWRLLTEDIEFTIDAVEKGYNVVYCSEAIFYDEQPTTFHMMFRQRRRWAKGFLQVFASRHNSIVKHMLFAKQRKTNQENTQTQLNYKLMHYDFYWHIFPYAIVTFFWKVLYYILLAIFTHLSGASVAILASEITIDALVSIAVFWGIGIIQILPVVILEWRQIYAKKFHKILYMLTFPFFDLMNIPISLAALFSPPDWKPIKHEDTRKIEAVDDFFTQEEIRREKRRIQTEKKLNKRVRRGRK